MREIIEKLYYGNIKPTEKPIKEESGYQESARLAVRHEEYLLKSLIGEHKATFHPKSLDFGYFNNEQCQRQSL